MQEAILVDFMATLIAAVPTWQLAIVFLVLQLLACELGFYWHHRATRQLNEKHEAGEETHVLAAALGLLALMIAFTFEMAQGRYEERRALVVEEANAIVATYLQVHLLDQPGRDMMTAELRRYIDIRLTYFDSDGDRTKLAAYDKASEAMHVDLWRTMLVATRPHRSTTVVDLVSEPLLRLIDAQADRRSARVSHVPGEVMQALVIYSLITALTLGYVMGSKRNRHRSASSILFLLTTISIMVTLDLDNPTSGGIQLSPEPLLSAREVIQTEFEPVAIAP
ncbi:MAG: hypothetical protein ACRCUI_13045 [Polymorphobacter sp.]